MLKAHVLIGPQVKYSINAEHQDGYQVDRKANQHKQDVLCGACLDPLGPVGIITVCAGGWLFVFPPSLCLLPHCVAVEERISSVFASKWIFN